MIVVNPSPSQAQARDWLAERAAQPQQVRHFCDMHKIMPSVVAAVQIAEEVFKDIQAVSLTVEDDPESEAQWLVVDVATTSDYDTALNPYALFVRKWAETPNPLARQLIHLTFCRV